MGRAGQLLGEEEEKTENIFQKILKMLSPKPTEDEKQTKWDKRVHRREKAVESGTEPEYDEYEIVEETSRIPHFKKIKRIVAGILVVINVILLFATFPTPFLILFAGNTAVFVDYLWRTGNIKLIKGNRL